MENNRNVMVVVDGNKRNVMVVMVVLERKP